jgi:hypothetical protein
MDKNEIVIDYREEDGMFVLHTPEDFVVLSKDEALKLARRIMDLSTQSNLKKLKGVAKYYGGL